MGLNLKKMSTNILGLFQLYVESMKTINRKKCIWKYLYTYISWIMFYSIYLSLKFIFFKYAKGK